MVRQERTWSGSGRRGLLGALALGMFGALVAGASGAPPATDVGITQSATPDPANVARELTYSLTATNIGPAVPRNLVVSDTLPASVTFVRLTASTGGNCNAPAVGVSGTVRCTWAHPPVGSIHTVAIVVKPTAVTTLANTATASAQGARDAVTANNSAATSIRAIPYALAANRARCTWVGTAAADVIKGTTAADVICGLGGNDTLYGLSGNDVVDGGAGNDLVYGGTGADRLYGGPGADRLLAGTGNDLLIGGLGRDLLSGGLGTDRARVLRGDTARSIERRI